MINIVFEEFQQERDRQVMRLTTRVIKMLSNGIELEKIAKETGIQIKDVKEIKNAYCKD